MTAWKDHGLLITLIFKCVQGHLESARLPQLLAVWQVSVSLQDWVWTLKRNLAHWLICEFSILALMGWFPEFGNRRQRTFFHKQLVPIILTVREIWTCFHFWCFTREKASQPSSVVLATCVWRSFWNTINTCLHVGRISGCKVTNWFWCCLLLECWWFFYLR